MCIRRICRCGKQRGAEGAAYERMDENSFRMKDGALRRRPPWVSSSPRSRVCAVAGASVVGRLVNGWLIEVFPAARVCVVLLVLVAPGTFLLAGARSFTIRAFFASLRDARDAVTAPSAWRPFHPRRHGELTRGPGTHRSLRPRMTTGGR
jgi:hypothetical protein